MPCLNGACSWLDPACQGCQLCCVAYVSLLQATIEGMEEQLQSVQQHSLGVNLTIEQYSTNAASLWLRKGRASFHPKDWAARQPVEQKTQLLSVPRGSAAFAPRGRGSGCLVDPGSSHRYPDIDSDRQSIIVLQIVNSDDICSAPKAACNSIKSHSSARFYSCNILRSCVFSRSPRLSGHPSQGPWP